MKQEVLKQRKASPFKFFPTLVTDKCWVCIWNLIKITTVILQVSNDMLKKTV